MLYEIGRWPSLTDATDTDIARWSKLTDATDTDRGRWSSPPDATDTDIGRWSGPANTIGYICPDIDHPCQTLVIHDALFRTKKPGIDRQLASRNQQNSPKDCFGGR